MNCYAEVLNNMPRRKPAPGDYYGEDKLLYCGKCHKPKECYVKELESVPGVSPIGNIMCECETKAAEEKKHKEEAHIMKEAIKKLRAKAFSNEKYKQYTFTADDNKDKKTSTLARAYVNKWDEMKRAGKGLTLFGSVGTGKTFAACCIANALIDIGATVYFIPVLDLINNYKSYAEDYKKRKEMLAKAKSVDLFIIDDLGTEPIDRKTNEALYAVIDTRYMSGKPLIVTSNLMPLDIYPESFFSKDQIQSYKELQENSGVKVSPALIVERERIYNRIAERCAFTTINAVKRRTQNALENVKETAEILGL